MKPDGIAVIGRLATGEQLLDGQTVKTRTLYQELTKCYPERSILCVDMYQYKRHVWKILHQTIHAFRNCEHIFVLLSRNGRFFFFPILIGMNAIFHRRLYHDVIGGALPEEVRKHPILRRCLSGFEINWVEFDAMRDALNQLGVKNVEVLPNFKCLHPLGMEQIQPSKGEPYVFSMFSRVIKEKGMSEAATAVAMVNQRLKRQAAILVIYGPVDPLYEPEFEAVLKKHTDCVFYKGCVPYEKSVETLSDSFMLLFPSTYPGEGVPGTLIDAFSAGVPVITTDWHYNAEFVDDGKTGYCYAWDKPELLQERILYAIEHPKEVDMMRRACLQEAQKYMPEQVMGTILRRMRMNEAKNV